VHDQANDHHTDDHADIEPEEDHAA
jgi:hypothetical protein